MPCSGLPLRKGPGLPAAITLVPGGAAAAGYDIDDADAQREAAGEIWAALFVFAVLAFALHLALRKGALRVLQDAAKGLAMLASAYLAAFFFLGSVSAIARFLLFSGMERETALVLAVPLGLVVAYKIYSVYERWRLHDRSRR